MLKINISVFFAIVALMLWNVGCDKDKPEDKPKPEPKKPQVIKKSKITGFVEKGPFVSGSALTANELDKDLGQTGRTFTTLLKNNEGVFEIKNLELEVPYLQLSVDGFFFNEVTGKLSKAKIDLYALSDVKDRSSVNVNLLTHIQKPRIEKLMDGGKTFAEAKKQSIIEIGRSFYLTEKQLKGIDPEDIKLTGNDEASKMLLAVSAIMLEGKTEAQLTQFLTNYSDDLADNGIIDKDFIKKTISKSSYNLHQWDRHHKRPIDYIIANVEKYYKEKIRKTVKIGDFSAYVDHNKNSDLTDYDSHKPDLSFDPLTRDYTGGKTISTAQILGKVLGKGKKGYTLKSITIADPTFATVTGTAPNLGIALLKTGDFKASITLEHPDFDDVKKDLSISVKAETFNFTALKRTSADGKNITTAQLLAQIAGAKAKGYRLKSIKISDDKMATVKGTAPNLSIELLKIGNFTADMVLENPNYFDVEIKGASVKSELPTFTFTALKRTYADGKTITTAQLLAQIAGAKAKGYQLKSIKISDDKMATVKGTAPNLSIELLKTGNFTADMVLEKANYIDVEIKGASVKSELPTFKFTELKRTYADGKTITTAQLLAQIAGAKAKGYQLKSIKISDDKMATVKGTAPNLSIELLKTGNFTADMVLEKANYFDVEIKGASVKSELPTLTFTALKRTYADGKTITTAQLLAQITGAKAKGYQLKSIKISDDKMATVKGIAPNLSIELLKTGKFTADIVLEKANYIDVKIKGGSVKSELPTFKFTELKRTYADGKTITTAQLLAQITGAKAKGYRLKSIKISDDKMAKVTGTAPNLSIELLKTGNFTADMVLENPNYFDVEIKGGSVKSELPNFTFTTLKRNYADGKAITTAQLLAKIAGAKAKGYRLKSIKISDDKMAKVTGTAPNLSIELLKTGSFTADIVLENANYFDVKIKGASVKSELPTFAFKALKRTYADGKAITTAQLLAQIKGAKYGYTIKSIKISDDKMATVKGTAPNLSIELLKTGSFTADIILENANYFDVEIKGASVKSELPTFAFKALKRNYADGKTITTAQLLAQIAGAKAKGYQLKSIKISDDKMATVKGTSPNLSIELLKIGIFTADMVLENTNYFDVEIKGATFKIRLDKTFGGSNDDMAYSLIQTTDGGYAMAGYTESKGGGYDFWLVKVDSKGDKQWDKTFGGSYDDRAFSLIQTTDGGYAMAGYTESKGGDYELWLVKVDSKGDKQWDKTFGGNTSNYAFSLIQTTDGGYAMAASGNFNFWLVKVDSKGDKQWDKTFGGRYSDIVFSLIQTTDGGYAMAGYTRIRSSSGWDFWLVKVDSKGDKQWDKTFGGSDTDWAYSLIQTTDGGYAMAGFTESKGAGGRDFWLVKVDSKGDKQWDKTFGGYSYDVAFSLIQTTDGGYAMAGHTYSKGAGSADFWLVKVDSKGDWQWDKTFGGSDDDGANSLIQTTDGGYAMAGYTDSKGAGGKDFWLVKVDQNGN